MNGGLQTRRRRRPELNLVPLIDVLVILVFFAFVTMQFRSAATLNITLPRMATAGENTFATGSVTLGIAADGTLSFATDRTAAVVVSAGELPAVLRRVAELNKDVPVLLRADETTPLKTLAFVMDACRQAGLSRFNLQSR
jgi:biopolymer transport protein ExbD